MKYLKEIKNILRKVCDNKSGYKVSDDEWVEMELQIVKSNPGIYTRMMNDIEVGISNGFTLEDQISIIEEVFDKKSFGN